MAPPVTTSEFGRAKTVGDLLDPVLAAITGFLKPPLAKTGQLLVDHIAKEGPPFVAGDNFSNPYSSVKLMAENESQLLQPKSKVALEEAIGHVLLQLCKVFRNVGVFAHL